MNQAKVNKQKTNQISWQFLGQKSTYFTPFEWVERHENNPACPAPWGTPRHGWSAVPNSARSDSSPERFLMANIGLGKKSDDPFIHQQQQPLTQVFLYLLLGLLCGIAPLGILCQHSTLLINSVMVSNTCQLYVKMFTQSLINMIS